MGWPGALEVKIFFEEIHCTLGVQMNASSDIELHLVLLGMALIRLISLHLLLDLSTLYQGKHLGMFLLEPLYLLQIGLGVGSHCVLLLLNLFQLLFGAFPL